MSFIEKYSEFKIYDQKNSIAMGHDEKAEYKRAYTLNVTVAPSQDYGGNFWGKQTEIFEDQEQDVNDLSDLDEFK